MPQRKKKEHSAKTKVKLLHTFSPLNTNTYIHTYIHTYNTHKRISVNRVAYIFHHFVELLWLISIHVHFGVGLVPNLDHSVPRGAVHPGSRSVQHGEGHGGGQLVNTIQHGILGPAQRLRHGPETHLTTGRGSRIRTWKRVHKLLLCLGSIRGEGRPGAPAEAQEVKGVNRPRSTQSVNVPDPKADPSTEPVDHHQGSLRG
ncbi:hypothetical protein F7725_011743 [Dissostichus mawsoni]|uniref:Uncharacterized protein n=1 Tax=Dissostichus mawsoni TaxID=36200 RepID=A0A7J5Z9Q1_DISMA|nr:hypothetical protein F7725_011743 [Dissostichus mawsoni]